MAHPDVRLVVQPHVPCPVDVQQRQPAGKHIAPAFGKGHLDPPLPLGDRPADAQRLRLGTKDPPTQPRVHPQPGIKRQPVWAGPSRVPVDRDKRIARLPVRADRRDQLRPAMLGSQRAHAAKQQAALPPVLLAPRDRVGLAEHLVGGVVPQHQLVGGVLLVQPRPAGRQDVAVLVVLGEGVGGRLVGTLGQVWPRTGGDDPHAHAHHPASGFTTPVTAGRRWRPGPGRTSRVAQVNGGRWDTLDSTVISGRTDTASSNASSWSNAGRSGSWAGGAQVASGGRGGLVWLARWSTRQAHQDLFSPRRGGCSRRVAGPSVQVCASCRLPWGVFESASGSAAREGDEVPVDRSRPPRTSRRAVAAGLLVALGVLVVIGRAERHALTPRPSTPASPVTTTTPPAPLAARIRVGRGVAAVAVGQGGVWALRSRSVVRVDPRTNRVTARIRAPAADSWDGRFALGAGALWVGTGADTIRVDVRTGRPSRVRVAAWAVAPDGLWSCQTPAQGRPAGLVRVDPRTLAETTRIPVPACPAALAAERGLVWAIDEPGRRVLRVDAASAHLTEIGLPVAPFAVSPTGPGLVALAVGAGAVWALSDQVESPTRLGARVGPGLVRIDPTSARVTGVTPLANLDAAGQALAVGAGGVWVLGVPVAPRGGARGSFVLDRVDPRSGRLLGSFTVAQLEFGV